LRAPARVEGDRATIEVSSDEPIVSVEVEGDRKAVSGAGARIDVAVPEGGTTFLVRAFDAAGNIGERTVAIAREVEGDIGWHGERMPMGMRKGSKEKEYLWEKDGSVMVYLPKGSFKMGSADGDDDEKPVHDVEITGFYVDKYEVTWGQWKRSGLATPEAPSWGIQDDHPVVNVSWNDAQEYLKWAQKRLPSEAEWEYAARGPRGNNYAWGDEEPDAGGRYRANYGPGSSTEDGHRYTAPVGSFAAGASWCGAHDMAGNVWEWCEDVYDASFYAKSPRKDPRNDAATGSRVVRGGSWGNYARGLRAAFRDRGVPGLRDLSCFGFRGAVSARAP
jgi:formylglycine-generating enzyme required for sulfatase activity